MPSFDETHRIPTQCVDNAGGLGGVVVYDDQTFPLRLRHDAIGWTVSGDGQGRYSSVRPFQPAYSDDGDVEDMDWGPPQTDSNSSASSVRPFQPAYSDNGDMEDVDWGPPQTDSNSSASTVRPFQPAYSNSGDVEDMDWDPPDTQTYNQKKQNKAARVPVFNLYFSVFTSGVKSMHVDILLSKQ